MAFKARRAAILISKKLKGFIFDKELENENLSVDDKLLELTKSYAGELITNDVYLKIKAFASGVRTKGYGEAGDYTGVTYWEVDLANERDLQDLSEAFDSHKKPERFGLKENEYLIVYNQDKEIQGIFHYEHEQLNNIRIKTIKNKWIDKITPRNPEQICLVNALYSESTIIYAGGPQGTGKSYLLNNFALQQLEKGEIDKIVYIPNNAYVKDSMEIGMLPGTSFEKTTPLIGPLIDLIGIDEVTRLL